MPPPLPPIYGVALASAGIVALVLSLIVASIPLWLASKILGLRRSDLGTALVALLVMALLFMAASIATIFIYPLNGLVGFIAALWGAKKIYDTGWLQAFLLVLVSTVIVVVMTLALASLLAGLALFPAHP